MLNFDKIYLVRHGIYGRHPEELTEIGKAESERAGLLLLAAGVKAEAMLLSSNAPRALQTSAIIASLIKATVRPSQRLNIIGNDPKGVSSLDKMLEAALVETGAKVTGESLIVVTHQPLLELAAFGARIANGQVVEYEPQTWQNPGVNNFQREFLNARLAQAGLGES